MQHSTLSNAPNLYHSLDYLGEVIQARFKHLSDSDDSEQMVVSVPGLAYYDDSSTFGNFIKQRRPKIEEYLTLLLALAPHIQPNYLDRVIKDALPHSGDFPEIGGAKDKNGRYFLPTGETALFLLAGNDMDRRFEVQQIFTADHWFAREQVLHLEAAEAGEPYFSGRLIMNPEYIELFTLGKVSTPPISTSFPAQSITTQLDWDDLVLPADTLDQIQELKEWVTHHQTLMQDWGMGRKLKPGFRALFYGPPGTGKTLTATLLGKFTGKEVYRVDLSMVVSKYIGETEKNLGRLFQKARNKDWILFFDEADALFGKRTEVKDAHDRYANQEVSYLLQRVENYPGLVILSSNNRGNIDDAFTRRFNAIIQFPMPRPSERLRIWKNAFPTKVELAEDIDFKLLAEHYEMSGANIMNVVQFACLKALAQKDVTISSNMILKGIQKEFVKEGKLM